MLRMYRQVQVLHHNTLAQPRFSHRPPHKIKPLCKSNVVPTQVQKQVKRTRVPKPALAYALQLTIHATYQGCESVQYSKYMLVLQDWKCNIRSRTALRSRGTGISGMERPSIWSPTEECHISSKLKMGWTQSNKLRIQQPSHNWKDRHLYAIKGDAQAEVTATRDKTVSGRSTRRQESGWNNKSRREMTIVWELARAVHGCLCMWIAVSQPANFGVQQHRLTTRQSKQSDIPNATPSGSNFSNNWIALSNITNAQAIVRSTSTEISCSCFIRCTFDTERGCDCFDCKHSPSDTEQICGR